LELAAQPELTHAWSEIRSELRRLVGDTVYEIWIEPLSAVDWDGRVLLLQTPADTRGWVAERYGRIIEMCAAATFDRDLTVSFGGTGKSQAGRPRDKPTDNRRSAAAFDISQAFNPRYSFEQFVIGDGNRLAHAASLAVSELPGQALNPLFLHAPPGLGKTHLLHAIGNYVLAFGGGAVVRYTTVESFTNHFIGSLASRSVDSFKRAYRDADVLLIDDVQFLASKARTEEEFFHTFNALYETGRQLVLTCDRLPRELVAVEERLRERFESGLVADIAPPDFSTRLTILRKRAALDRVELPDPAILELIAERITSNVRALEGALIAVVAEHSLARTELDLELAAHVLDRIEPRSRPTAVSLDEVQRVVAEYFELTAEDLKSPTRTARVAWARQVAMHLARELTRASLPSLGNAFGGRNHATVHHACRKVSDRLRDDPEVSTVVAELRATLTGRQGDRSC
jgi:chromosomal replication initiator protein